MTYRPHPFQILLAFCAAGMISSFYAFGDATPAVPAAPPEGSKETPAKTTVIALAKEYVPLVLSGKKTTTVRAGKRSYVKGPAELKGGGQLIPIEILEVRYTTFEALTEQNAISDGFSSLQELQNALWKFYPKLQGSDDITIVSFKVATER